MGVEDWTNDTSDDSDLGNGGSGGAPPSDDSAEPKRRDYLRKLLDKENDEARVFVASLLQSGLDFRKTTRLVLEQYLGGGDERDIKNFSFSLYRIAEREFKTSHAATSPGQPPSEQTIAGLRGALASWLVAHREIPPDISRVAEEKARPFYPEKIVRDKRAVEAQNTIWEGREEAAALVGKMWEAGASHVEIQSALKVMHDIIVSEHALRHVLPHPKARSMDAQALFARCSVSLKAQEDVEVTVQSLHGSHRDTIRGKQARGATERWDRVYAARDIVGTPLFGEEPPATRHWWLSPRARSLVVFLLDKGESMSIVADAIEKAYGIPMPTKKYTIAQRLKQYSKEAEERGVTQVAVFVEKEKERLAEAGTLDGLMKEAARHAAELESRGLVKGLGAVKAKVKTGEAVPAKNAFRREDTPPSKDDAENKYLVEAYKLVNKTYTLEPDDQQWVDAAVKLVSEVIVSKQRKAEDRSGVVVVEWTRSLIRPGVPITNENMIPTLRVSVDLREIAKESRATDRRWAFLKRITKILEITDPSTSSGNDLACYTALEREPVRRIMLYARDRYGPPPKKQGWFLIGSFLRKPPGKKKNA